MSLPRWVRAARGIATLSQSILPWLPVAHGVFRLSEQIPVLRPGGVAKGSPGGLPGETGGPALPEPDPAESGTWRRCPNLPARVHAGDQPVRPGRRAHRPDPGPI